MSRSKSRQQQVSKNEQRSEYRNFRVVFFYCILIIVLPVVTFFGSKYFLFDGFLQLTPVSSNIYSAVSAVIVLHIALGLYIYRAYFDSGSGSSSGNYQRLSQKQD
ncbi:vacuolar ATPase assembly integral membrane protein VMA21 homolog [Topomyia yanbarensis]|uniref:vacuolar ATPase assembly integral membrane protein VMA21 homolog n=1 Tax=Topomyia yanbarensis TaxID=2498891 RepID=UPI00273AAD35|nr:vacuolar ATPase assembly integral membrane protein VMA21 homolog [Topomyia yanbarensis]